MAKEYITISCFLLILSQLAYPKTVCNIEEELRKQNNSTNYTKAGNLTTNETHLTVVYWEIKPFIFTNNKGEIDGILPKIFEQASVLCNQRNKFFEFVTKIDSRKKFYDTVRSNLSYDTDILEGVEEKKAFWAPIFSPTNVKNDEFLKRRHLKSFQLLTTKGISVIVRRDLISLPNKILRGVLACEQIFVLAILLAILFGILLWTIERYRNDDLPDTFIRGVGIGLYWSIVSMTTVGYGDVQPKTPVGRLVACFWLFVGVMSGCIMTATLTDVVNGNDFTVKNKKVSVLENSFEEQVASNQYQANVVRGDSYDHIIRLVRDGEVFAAMMNSDIAHWYNDEISNDNEDVPLRIVQTLPAHIYVHCLMPTEVVEVVKNIFTCMYFQKDEVYFLPKESFNIYHEAETLYIGSTTDLISRNLFVRGLIGVLGAIIVIGICFDLFKYRTKKQEEKTRLRNGSLTELEKFTV